MAERLTPNKETNRIRSNCGRMAPFVAGRSAPAGEAGTNGGLTYAEEGKGAANAALTAITSPDVGARRRAGRR